MTFKRRLDSSEGVYIQCDGCSAIYEPCEPSVQEAWAEAQAVGWRAAGSHEFCPRCAASNEPLRRLLSPTS